MRSAAGAAPRACRIWIWRVVPSPRSEKATLASGAAPLRAPPAHRAPCPCAAAAPHGHSGCSTCDARRVGARHQAWKLQESMEACRAFSRTQASRGWRTANAASAAMQRGAPVVDGGEVARVERAAEERADDVRAVAVAVAVVCERAVQPDLAVGLAGEGGGAGGWVRARRRRPVDRRVAKEAVVAVCRPARVIVRVRFRMGIPSRPLLTMRRHGAP
jgi:hypothetical protein